MKFSIVVLGAPYSSQSPSSALAFTRAALESGHGIYRLFFYLDGVHNGSALAVPPQDEVHIPRAWQTLILEHQIDAVVCAASALKRGLLDAGEAERYDRMGASLLDGFLISGLGQLVDASLNSDRVISFPA
ncbi:MAG: sulfurtransferase complex subunit TusD [Pseudohongiellaceae bacterium]